MQLVVIGAFIVGFVLLLTLGILSYHNDQQVPDQPRWMRHILSAHRHFTTLPDGNRVASTRHPFAMTETRLQGVKT